MELENDHSVYILGAGFSCDAGLPTMVPFLQRMRDAHPWLLAQGRTREAAVIESVLDFRLKAASAAYRVPLDVENVEHLFSLASARGEEEWAANVSLAIAATLDFAEKSAEPRYMRLENTNPPRIKIPSHWVEKQASPPICFAPLYDFICGVLVGGYPPSEYRRTTFVSFNYDTVVEKALENLGVRYTYGFSRGPGGDANFNGGTRSEPRGEPECVELFKLHGSVNWGLKAGPGRPLTLYRDYDSLRAAVDSDDAKPAPVLLPPTWRKDFQGALSKVWDQAVEALRTATRVVILGFSMPETDLHFRYLIAAGLQDNISLREIVVGNPAPDAADRARALFRPEAPVRVAKDTLLPLIQNSNNRTWLRGGPSAVWTTYRPVSDTND